MDLSWVAAFAPFFPLVLVVVLAVPFFWVTLRVRSLFLLRVQLWKWANRHDGGGNDWLGGPIAERRELMKYRSLLVWADSYPQARRVARWAEEHGVDLGTLGECGEAFDPHNLRLVDVPVKAAGPQWVPAMLLFLGYVLLFAGALLATQRDAIVSLRSNGHWLSLTQSSARPFGSEHYTAMTLADCRVGTDPARFGADRAAVCGFLSDPRLPAAVAETITGQRTAGGVLVGVAFLTIGASFSRRARSKSSRAVRAVRNDLEWHARQVAENDPTASGFRAVGKPAHPGHPDGG